MAIESTDDLKDLPHVVILRRGNEMTIREFAGAGCMERAHDYAQREALGARDVEALVAMRYRRIGGPGVPRQRAALADSAEAARYVRGDDLDCLRAERDALGKALLQARRWIGDGDLADGLHRDIWTARYKAVVALVDFTLSSSGRFAMHWQVIDAAARLCMSFERAMRWFYGHKIADLGDLTPFHLVEAGKAEVVLAYIESLSAGASG